MAVTADSLDPLREMHTALVNDVTDEMGIYDNVLPYNIDPLWGRETIVGRALTVHNVDVSYEFDTWEEHARTHLEAIEAIQPGHVVVHSGPGSLESGLWGELLSAAAQQRGAHGAVIDGLVRDSRLIEDHEFPVWCRGDTAADAFGRSHVDAYDIPVDVGGVRVEPGDIIMADYESIVRIKPDRVETVVERAEEKLDEEDVVRDRLRAGDSVWDVVEEEGEL